MSDKLTEQTSALSIDDHQRRSNAIISNSETDRNLIPASQRNNRRQSHANVDYVANKAFDALITKKSNSKHSMSSFNRRVNRDDEDRDLRSSAACLNLQAQPNNEVTYKNGRKSTLAKTLETRATRISVMENIEEPKLRQSYLQNLNCTGTLLGKNSVISPLAASVNNSNDNVGYNLTNAEEYEQNETEINDRYFDNYRRGSEEQENLHRVSSVISNKNERLSQLREGLDIPDKKRSTLSNEELVEERRKDPSMRRRPTSAGNNATAKNSVHSYNMFEDEEKCLSDTEVDTMEIELMNLNILTCQY